jgi:hypothetical protein
MKSPKKWSINVSTKVRLRSVLDWFASILIASIALLFVYSAQVFQEQNRQAWANVFTTVGSLMLSLVSLHMGSRIQQDKDKKDERKLARKTEVSELKIYIHDVSGVVEQLKRAENLGDMGKENESDLIRSTVKEKLISLQGNYPSANAILDSTFRCKIESAIQQVGQSCEDVITQNVSVQELSNALQSALLEIQEYENIE